MEMAPAYEQFVYVSLSEFAWEMAAAYEQLFMLHCQSLPGRICHGDGSCL